MSFLDRTVLRGLLRLLLSLTFRRLSVLGAERVPKKGPLLIIGAAKDAVLDPLLVLWASPRPLRCLARPSLFKSTTGAAVLGSLAFAPGVLLSSPDGPGELVSRCEHALVGGEALALFLSGGEQGSSIPSGVELVVGALLGARARGVHLSVVSARWAGAPRFPRRGWGRLLFSFPLDWEETGQPNQPPAALQTQLAKAIDEGEGDFAWYQELELLEMAAPLARELLKNREMLPDPPGAPQGGFEERRRWAWLEFPLKFGRLREQAGAYFGLLEALGISADEAARCHVRVPDKTYFRLLFALGGLPAAFYGWAFHVLPFVCSTWLARESAEERKRPYGALVLWTSLLVFPLFYGLQAWAFWQVAGGWRGLIFTAAAIPAVLWALVYGQFAEGAWKTARALVKYRLTGRLDQTLQERRARLLLALEPLLWLFKD
jgi:hypothetical protein